MCIPLPSFNVDVFNMHAVRDSAAEGDLHAMDKHKERPSKRATTHQGYDVSDVDSKLIQISLYAMPAFDVGNTSESSE